MVAPMVHSLLHVTRMAWSIVHEFDIGRTEYVRRPSHGNHGRIGLGKNRLSSQGPRLCHGPVALNGAWHHRRHRPILLAGPSPSHRDYLGNRAWSRGLG